MLPKDRIICAIDVDNAFRAIQLVGLLQDKVGVFKVGLELLTSAGISIVEKLQDAGAEKIFLDAKLHDIPNTVAGAMRGVVRQRVWCVTVHASGGSTMLQAAVMAGKKLSEEMQVEHPKILAVTLLTSIGAEALHSELLSDNPVEQYVAHMATMAYACGCDGVIASPHEIEAVRSAVPDRNFLVITPGVRPVGDDAGDQSRVKTPSEAIMAGADYLVIGRPITGANDPAAAAESITHEIAAACS